MSLVDIMGNVSKAENSNLFEQQKIMSHMLVNAFLQKIGKEDLAIFGQIIKQSDLLPHHVGYVHDLVDDEIKAELCFTLAKQIPVPDFEGYYAEKIIVEMGNDGTILEVSTHVSPIEQEAGEDVQQENLHQ